MKTGLKAFGIFLVGLIIVGAMGLVTKVVLFPNHVANKAVDTAYGVVDKTLNADNAIYNYEWFKRQYNDYIALKNKVDLSKNTLVEFESKMPTDRSKWAREDKDEQSRLNTILLGQKQQLADLISEYNAKSQMANRTIFKTGDLPEQLPNYVQ